MIISDEQEFNNIINRVCYKFANTNKYDNDELLAIKHYIIKNPNSPSVIKFLKDIADYYYSFFDNKNLNNALNISNDYYYQKKQEIFRYLPFNLNNIDHPAFFYRILHFKAEKNGTISNNFYPTLFEFLREQHIHVKNINLKSEILEFVKSNKAIMNAPKDYYGYGKTINEEEYWYNVFLNRIYKKNIILDHYQSYEDALKEYENKIIGNIGEFYIYNLLNDKIKNPYVSNLDFVAKELGNGFGYDIYFQYLNRDFIKEYLIEVKTTFNKNYINGIDSFNLTDNEFNIMTESLVKNKEYRVYRVYKDNKYNFHKLMFDMKDSFKDVNNKSIIYKFDHIDDNNNKVFVLK